MDFSLMFWGDTSSQLSGPEYYDFVLDVCRYADTEGFRAVWLPERHFHTWGGSHPNPSVLAAAVATQTKKIQIRSGSIVLPLHHPLRIVEEWSLVDNLSRGRVELSVATGWKDDDFVLAPEKYSKRREDFGPTIKLIQNLWQGGRFSGLSGGGSQIEVSAFPKPVQAELPIWITSAGSLRTIASAGGAGVNLLTHLLGQDQNTLEKSITQYRAYRVRSGAKDQGKVALMLHSFLAESDDEAKAEVKDAMSAYLKNSADLFVPLENRQDWATLAESRKNEMVNVAFERYFHTASLMGTVKTCKSVVDKLTTIGVTEIACLIDFGMDPKLVLKHLDLLRQLKDSYAR